MPAFKNTFKDIGHTGFGLKWLCMDIVIPGPRHAVSHIPQCPQGMDPFLEHPSITEPRVRGTWDKL